MELSTWLLFSGMALVAVISPGPAVLLSVTNSLTLGFGLSLVSSLGNITGLFLVSGAAALGLGAVLETSVLLFTILKICGAVYLIYLGIRQWRSRGSVFEAALDCTSHSRTGGMSFVQGVFQSQGHSLFHGPVSPVHGPVQTLCPSVCHFNGNIQGIRIPAR